MTSVSRNNEFKPWLILRHLAEDGKVTHMVPRYFKPLSHLDVVETHNDHQIKFVIESIIEGDVRKEVSGTATTTITFHNPSSIYGLVKGGWLPLPFVNPPYFLVDRNVVATLAKITNGILRQDVAHTKWWFSLSEKFHPTINPILYAWEGDRRRPPTYGEFCDHLVKASEQISLAIPEATVVRFRDEFRREAYHLLVDISKRKEQETTFLLYAIPLIRNRVPARRLGEYRRDLVNKAKELGLNASSLAVVAVFSCLFENQDGSGHPVARKILKPSERYTEQDAYNALSDLGALQLYMFLSTLKQRPISLCTCDRAMAAFWCLLRPHSISCAEGKMTVPVVFDTELFPRLSQEEINCFIREANAN